MKLFGAGTDSGTFEYFNEAINGDKAATRKDYSPSEDDNVTVQGVSGGKGNLGYFGLSYAIANKDKVKTLQVDGGDGCVEPDHRRPSRTAATSRSHGRSSSTPRRRPCRTRRRRSSSSTTWTTTTRSPSRRSSCPMTSEQAQKAKDAVTQLEG